MRFIVKRDRRACCKVGGSVEGQVYFSLQLDACHWRILPAADCYPFSLCCVSFEASVDSHVEDLGSVLIPGSGELHRREVRPLSESHRLLRPVHRRGLLQSAWQRRGGGGTLERGHPIWVLCFYTTLCIWCFLCRSLICMENECKCISFIGQVALLCCKSPAIIHL